MKNVITLTIKSALSSLIGFFELLDEHTHVQEKPLFTRRIINMNNNQPGEQLCTIELHGVIDHLDLMVAVARQIKALNRIQPSPIYLTAFASKPSRGAASQQGVPHEH